MTVEFKDHFPKMPTFALHRLLGANKHQAEIWEREHMLAKTRGIPAEIARLAARLKKARIEVRKAEVSLQARDQAWGQAS